MNYTHKVSGIGSHWDGDEYYIDINNPKKCVHATEGKTYYQMYEGGWWKLWHGSPNLKFEEIFFTLENE